MIFLDGFISFSSIPANTIKDRYQAVSTTESLDNAWDNEIQPLPLLYFLENEHLVRHLQIKFSLEVVNATYFKQRKEVSPAICMAFVAAI